MEDEFDILAAKVLAEEATAQERARLDSMTAGSAELRDEFAALQSTWNVLKDAAPIVQAGAAPCAEIPPDRLRHLQQLVRESRLASSAAPADQAHTRGHAARSNGPSVPELFVRWWQQWNGAKPGRVTLALILAIAGAAYWINGINGINGIHVPATQPRPTAVNSTAPLAHLLVLQGRPEIHRDGTTFAASAIDTLREGDAIRLPAGTEVSLITRGGEIDMPGPARSTARALAEMASAAHSSTNAMLPGALTLRAALFYPVTNLFQEGFLVATRSAQGIPLYSPAGATASLTPLILWKNEHGKTYDVRITDEFNAATPPWILSAATSPVEFSKVESWLGRKLSPDGLYRLRISETGRLLTTCEYTFQTVNDELATPSGATVNPLRRALRILTSSPNRVGDALAILLTLPPELAQAELALRLKLMVFGQLGYQADFDEIAAALRTMP